MFGEEFFEGFFSFGEVVFHVEEVFIGFVFLFVLFGKQVDEVHELGDGSLKVWFSGEAVLNNDAASAFLLAEEFLEVHCGFV